VREKKRQTTKFKEAKVVSTVIKRSAGGGGTKNVFRRQGLTGESQIGKFEPAGEIWVHWPLKNFRVRENLTQNCPGGLTSRSQLVKQSQVKNELGEQGREGLDDNTVWLPGEALHERSNRIGKEANRWGVSHREKWIEPKNGCDPIKKDPSGKSRNGNGGAMNPSSRERLRSKKWGSRGWKLTLSHRKGFPEGKKNGGQWWNKRNGEKKKTKKS